MKSHRKVLINNLYLLNTNQASHQNSAFSMQHPCVYYSIFNIRSEKRKVKILNNFEIYFFAEN